MRGFLILLLFLPFLTTAQERCAANTTWSNKIQLDEKKQFENWLSQRLESKRKSIRMGVKSGQQEEIYVIPVVFHIVHTGTPIGTEANLPKTKILEQVEILNQDFRRQNADAANTPEDFLAVAADTRIQFVLAKQDPEGLPTDGIVRVAGSKDSYNPNSSTDDILLKGESFWPPEDYLNIYITDLSDGYLGSAQYPFTNLPGIRTELNNYRSTDGVIVDYKWIGNNDNTGSFDSRGRTLTHEIGHFLGLRHIWGDSNNCGADDFCSDTPFMTGSNSGKSSPCSYPGRNSCQDEENDLPDMFQNFMDYTDDECMNLFTTCQKERMRMVLELSPRRNSLLTSPGLEEPIVTANDLGIKSILNPTKSNCSNVADPLIAVRNYGNNQISSFEVTLYLNGEPKETLSFNTTLEPLEVLNISFSSLSIPSGPQAELSFQVTSVNGAADGNELNDVKAIDLPNLQSVLVPYSEDFTNNTTGPIYRSTENRTTSQWIFANEAAVLPFYSQSENFGIQDMLLSEVLDLSSLTSAEITFRYAYAPRTGADYLDGLIVAVSTNCGQDFHHQDFLFEAYGPALGTTSPRNIEFIPEPTDWEERSINLTNYTGYENVQVAFIGVNGLGNNIYLDDIHITSANLLAHDAGLRAVSSLPVVSCSGSVSPFFEIKNYGYEKIESLEVTVEVDGIQRDTTFSDLNILSGFAETFKMNMIETLDEGYHEISVNVNKINGLPDEQPFNNTTTHQLIIDSETETIPVKEDFESANWITTSTDGQSIFQRFSINTNSVLKGNTFDTLETGQISYLVSPILKTSNYKEAAIRFKYSYANRTGYNDNLKVLLSFNCGRSFTTEVLNLHAEQLADTTSNQPWEPKTEEDWQTAFIDISEHLVWDEIRIAFVFTNGNGNNIYLDDIEVITSANPDLPEFDDLMVIYPNPTSQGSFDVALNLFSKQDVEIRIVNMSGQVVFSQLLPDALNQTYHFETPSQGGVYLVQMLGSDGVLNQVKRLYIRH